MPLHIFFDQINLRESSQEIWKGNLHEFSSGVTGVFYFAIRKEKKMADLPLPGMYTVRYYVTSIKL